MTPVDAVKPGRQHRCSEARTASESGGTVQLHCDAAHIIFCKIALLRARTTAVALLPRRQLELQSAQRYRHPPR